MSKSLNSYLKEINKYPILSKEEELELILKAQFGDKTAIDKLIVSNLRFVITIAKKFITQGVELEDLIQEGNLGLITSIKKFDPKQNVKFLSYAIWWIKQSLFSYLNMNSRLIRLPVHIINEKSSDQDILKLDTENCIISESDDLNILDIIPNTNCNAPDHEIIQEALKYEIDEMLNCLNDKEQEIIKYYFGINKDRQYTLDEIGEKLNLTRERVRQIKELVLNRLSLKPKFKNLIEYL